MVDGLCDVDWSPQYPSPTDFRGPFHAWVTSINLNRRSANNAVWDVTDGGKTKGVICSQDGSMSFRSLAEASVILEHGDDKGVYIHTDLLKCNS